MKIRSLRRIAFLSMIAYALILYFTWIELKGVMWAYIPSVIGGELGMFFWWRGTIWNYSKDHQTGEWSR
jgi:hypothetical protein